MTRLGNTTALATVVLIVLSLLPRTAAADSVSLGAAKDATIYADQTGNANGAGPFFHVGNNSGNNRRRGLIRFDLSAIPSGSIINSVTLTLHSDNSTDNGGVSEAITIHRLTQDWSEGTSIAPSNGGGGTSASANDVTWAHRIFNIATWTTAGGTHITAASASTVVPPSPTTGSFTWSGTGMVNDVQAWVNGTGNFGWLLKGNESAPQSARRISSRQNDTAAERPKLAIDFTPPVTSGACCAANGTCASTTSTACGLSGGNYQGSGTSCSPNPCPQPTGGCCFGNGSCSLLTPGVCAGSSGTYRGDATICAPPCPVLSGACCFPNATCTFVTQAACLTAVGTYQGDTVTCVSVSCPWILDPFIEELSVPLIAVPTTGVVGGVAHYEVEILQRQHRFHRALPLSTVWGYNGQYPGPTIEAGADQTVTVNWRNGLRDGNGNLLVNHLLAVDTCLHGPNITGTVPVTVTHLHGAHVQPESDGAPDTAVPPGVSSPLYIYPNHQRPATLWYHDHALGLTRLNVYMGLAGFYLLRDQAEQALGLPSGTNEVPLIIQDRSFNPNGSLKYNAVFSDSFLGDFAVVNGKVSPFMNVKRGMYRFRILNGSNTRTYQLRLNAGASPNAPWWQIGSDLGLLAEPVELSSAISAPVLTIMPGERADVVIDFANVPAGGHITMENLALSPFPGGGSGPNIPNIMRFVVQNTIGHTNPLPVTLATVPRTPESEAVVHRSFQLTKVFDNICSHDMWLINSLMWDDITDFPVLGTTEIWSWVNRSGISHPMHMHLVEFQILDRQNFTVDIGGNIIPTGTPTLPPPGEMGWKDTVQATPNQITRVISRFLDYPGTFPFHCHILEHEDHEMMRQFTVVCAPIAFSPQPLSAELTQGQTATLTVAATGSGPLTYQWLRTDPEVTLINGPTTSGSIISGATSPTFTITNTQLSDAGRHACRVTDACGNTSISGFAVLTVLCLADFNNSGSVSVQDIFDFLTAYFSGQPTADFNSSGAISVQDIFDFLAAYFAGCS